MKRKGIWFVMVLITVLGIGITSYTSRVTGQGNTLMMNTTAVVPTGAAVYAAEAPAAAQAAMEAAPELERDAGAGRMAKRAAMSEAETAADAYGIAPASETAAALAPEAVVEADGMEEGSPVISPLSGGSKQPADAAASGRKTSEEYRDRLTELDGQIAKAREEDMSTTTGDILAAFSNELRMWEAEVSSITDGIKEVMDEERTASFLEEEKAWMQKREQKAREAAAQYQGGTMEPVEYSASMAALTREHAYELLNVYGSLLDE